MVSGQQQNMMMNGNGGAGGGGGGAPNDNGHAMSPNGVGNGIGQVVGAAPLCIRSGCTNHAVSHADWEDEYCSNECVITHCRCVKY